MQLKEAKLLEGKTLAAKIQEDIKAKAAKVGVRPRLLVIQVGQNPASEWYVGQQKKLAEKLGIEFDSVPADRIKNQKDLLREIQSANSGKTHGVFITMPLPAGFDADEALLALSPQKDVEGIHPVSLGLIVLRKSKLIPPTAYAAFKLIESTGVSLKGKKAVIVGQSAIVGRPVQMLLGEQRVTTIVCNTGTPEAELRKAVSESDILVACAGKPNLIKGSWIPEGQIVIDVGTSDVAGKMTGDVEFEEAKKRASYITPVPGGVGPLTVTMLMQNLMHAYEWQKNN